MGGLRQECGQDYGNVSGFASGDGCAADDERSGAEEDIDAGAGAASGAEQSLGGQGVSMRTTREDHSSPLLYMNPTRRGRSHESTDSSFDFFLSLTADYNNQV